MIIINTVIFFWVVSVVIRHAREKVARTNTTISNKQILRMTISISGVLFLFGLTWVFFVLTISVSGLRETFQILFTVFNSLQGFFVFVFILFTEGLEYWKEILQSCLKSKPVLETSLDRSVPLKKKSGADASTLLKTTFETPHSISTTDCEVNVKQPNQMMEELEDNFLY